MNLLVHFFFNFTILSLFINEINQYIIPVFIFSIIIDIEHVYSIFYLPWKKPKKLLKSQLRQFRTVIQEPLGIITIVIILEALYIVGVRSIIIHIAAICMILHWILDFLTGYTRPFAPINDKLISLFISSRRHVIIREVVGTAIFGALFLIQYSK